MLSGGPLPGVRRCAVLGHPVAHSLSPLLHRTAYARLGLAWTYDAHDVTAAALAGFLQGLDHSWRGLSLTMPLKRTVLPLLDDMDATVHTVGAANTVLLAPGHRYGANTDVSGLVTALRAAGAPRGQGRAVVMGGGATAASALAALVELGFGSVEVRVRDQGRAADILRAGQRLGLEVRVRALDDPWPAHPRGGVVVSTVPSGVAADVLAEAALEDAVVADVRYAPWPSPLLQRAERVGAATASGIDVLVHQAVEQVRLMTGRPVEPRPLLEVALAAVRRPARLDQGPGYAAGS